MKFKRDPYRFTRRYRIRYWFKGWLAERQIKPGDIYEDCNYHPVLCTENNEGDLFGVSLIDGTGPRGCSMFHCGVVKMTVAEALERKKNWATFEPHSEVDWDALSGEQDG